MTAPTHIITGLAAVVVVGRVTGVTPDAVSLMAVIFGSLAPDIDGTGVITRPGTILRQLIGRGPANLLDAVFEFIAAAVHFFFGHRGFIHSPLLAFGIFGLGATPRSGWNGLASGIAPRKQGICGRQQLIELFKAPAAQSLRVLAGHSVA